MIDQDHLQSKLDRITRRWWFFGLFVLIQFVPPYASKGYKFPDEWGDVIMHALRYAFIYSYSWLFPIFKIIPMILVIGIIVFRNKVTRLFNIYVALSYVLFAFGQSIAVTEKYGMAVCTNGVIMFLIVAAFWAWEAIVVQNDFKPAKIPIWRYWVVPLALLAFWYPVDFRTARLDLNPVHLFTNVAGVTFCMMTPVYLALLSLYWPRVNIATMRVTSIVGIIIGLYNMAKFANFSRLWWLGILHIPLLIISVYGLILSLKRPQVKKQADENTE